MYTGDNPESDTDPTGNLSIASVVEIAVAAALIATGAGIIAIVAVAAVEGFLTGFIASGGNFRAGLIGAIGGAAMAYIGGAGISSLFLKSALEGFVGGVLTEANGGRFTDGFLGAFVSSEAGGQIDSNIMPKSESAGAIAARTGAAAAVGGTASKLSGGNFANGAWSAAFQHLFNDEADRKALSDKLGALKRKGILSRDQSFRTRDAAAKYVLNKVTALSHEYGYEVSGNLYQDKYRSWHYSGPWIGSTINSRVYTSYPAYHTHPSGRLVFSNQTNSANGEKINDATWVDNNHQALYLGVELPNHNVGIAVCEYYCSLIGRLGTPGKVIQP